MKPVKLSDLPSELQAQIRKDEGLGSGKVRFTKEDVRRFALKALATLSQLDQGERTRVLKHCLKVNEI